MQFIDPLLQILSSPLKRDRTVRPLVIVLLGARSPLAVVGRISLIVINAVKGIASGRTAAHILKKISKLVPAITDRNTTSAVVGVTLIGRSITSSANGFPNSVFGYFIGHPVLFNAGSKSNFTQTPAISAVATSQILSANSSPLTALAVAEPNVAAGCSNAEVAKYKQNSKTLVDQAFHRGRAYSKRNFFDILNVSQDSFTSLVKLLRLGLTSRYNALSACFNYTTPQSVTQLNFLGLNPSVETPY